MATGPSRNRSRRQAFIGKADRGELQEIAVKGLVLWMLGIPLPLILLGYCTGVLN